MELSVFGWLFQYCFHCWYVDQLIVVSTSSSALLEAPMEVSIQFWKETSHLCSLPCKKPFFLGSFLVPPVFSIFPKAVPLITQSTLSKGPHSTKAEAVQYQKASIGFKCADQHHCGTFYEDKTSLFTSVGHTCQPPPCMPTTLMYDNMCPKCLKLTLQTFKDAIQHLSPGHISIPWKLTCCKYYPMATII